MDTLFLQLTHPDFEEQKVAKVISIFTQPTALKEVFAALM
jgi:hypothetical protein